MKDIKVQFNGSTGAVLDLNSQVEGKSCCEQECLLNLATEQGSDPLYEERGTTIMTSAVSGAIVGINDAIHVGNFAALDTVRFIVVNFPQYTTSDDTTIKSLLQNVNITGVSFANDTLSYGVQIEFTDGTSTGTIDVALAAAQ